MAELVNLTAHGEATPPPPEGKLVLSRLGAGESKVLALTPGIKVVLEGEEIHEVDGRPYPVRPGQMLVVDRGAPYRCAIRRNVTTIGLCVYLPSQWSEMGVDWPLLGRALVKSTDADSLGKALCAHGVRLHRGEATERDAAQIMAHLHGEFYAMLSRSASCMERLDVQKASTRHEVLNRLESARAYLHENIERAVPLSELASAAGLSSFHLARYFSAAFGVPPARYHRRLRLNRADELLRKDELSITEIAFRAGYSELSAFSHAYRREFARPPSAPAVGSVY